MGPLLLSPELLELALLKGVEIAVLSLPSRLLSLAQPFWVKPAVLEIKLELTNAIAPVIGVSNERFREWGDFCVGVVGREL
jgi:hypothetical protein